MNYTFAQLLEFKEKYEAEKAAKDKYEAKENHLKQLKHDWYEAHKEEHIARVRAAEKIRRAKKREEKMAEKARLAEQKAQSIKV